jgi:predicted esterase
MTKQDRLDEIADYTHYLRMLYDTFKSKLPENVKIILLGFSQGCATQCRWIMREFPDYDHLILWAGLFPEDLDYTPHQDYFNNKKTIFIYGKNDQYVTPEILKWQDDFAKEQGINIEVRTFEGKHEIDRTLLKAIAFELKS